MVEIIDVKGRKVFCAKDKYSEEWTLTLVEKGGPMVSNKDFDKALEKFEEALEFCWAVDILVMHSRMSKEGATDEEITKAWKDKRKL